MRPRPPALMRAPITWLLLTFLAVGATYIINTPPFEAPDEYGHYAYVRYLAEERRLPPLVVSDHEWLQGQMHQPPLYYLLGALLVGGLDTPEWQAAYPRNPLARLGDPSTPVHRNAVIHPGIPTEATRRTATALRVLRSFSLLCSAVTVWLAYCLVRLIAPERRWLALGSAAMVAFNPQFLFISASANNDVLVTMLASAVLYLSARVAYGRGRPLATPLGIGALVGLAALAKLSGLATIVLPAVAYLLLLLSHDDRNVWQDFVGPVVLCVAMALLVSGGWFLRNAFTFSDALGMTHYAAVFAVHEDNLSLATSLRIMREALPSYWGVFGWLNVLMPFRYYRLVELVSLAVIIGLVVWAIQAWRRRSLHDPASVRAATIAVLWGLVVLGLLLSWTMTITRTQGRLAFPAAGVFAMLSLVGLTSLVPQRLRPVLTGLLVSALLLVTVAVPWRVIAPAYQLTVKMPAQEVPEGLRPLNVRYGDDLTLLAAEILSAQAVAGEYVWVRMYWQANEPIDVAYVEAVQLAGATGERLGGIDTAHAMGRYPSDVWVPGEITIDNAILPVERAAASPVAVAVRVAVYTDSPTDPLPAFDGEGQPLGTLAEIGRVRMYPGGYVPPAPEHLLDQTLNGLRLYGYDLSAEPDGAGGATLSLHLYWECQSPVTEAYTTFVHLVDGAGALVDQDDAPPLQGAYDTQYWWAGDRVRSTHTLAIATDSLNRPLTVRVGLYHPATGERVVPSSGDGRDYVELGPFSITPEGVVY